MVRERDGQREREREKKVRRKEREKERATSLLKNARSTHLEDLEKNRLRREKKRQQKKPLISARTKTKVPIRKL